jgi:hypothetical protein
MRPIIVATLALAIALPTSALAKGGKGKGKKDDGERHESHTESRSADVDVSIHFGSHERDIVREYYVEKHGRGNCPPGLAKKNNGCLPPGQAKKRYTVGKALPSTVVIHELPRDISVRIGPAPRGYRYGIVDGDIVKLAIGTALVVDAIDGLVN